jgi:hypothetical protein
MSMLRGIFDKMLGRGDWAVTIPILDGPLLPNQALEEAETFASMPDIDNLVATELGLVASSGGRVMRFDAAGESETIAAFDQPVSALTGAKGMLAIGLDGEGVVIQGGPHDGRRFTGDGSRKFGCVTALTFLDAQTLLMANGSETLKAGEWRRDLMQKGASGSLWKLDLKNGNVRLIADGLAWPAGIATTGSNRIYVSESWRHRILAIDLASGQSVPVLEHLPAYPARISPAYDAGYWLSFYSVRNQLVEFILREDGYRNRMLAEVPEPAWMAPSLSSGISYREPMQGSQLKQMGVLKPYAVTRSYGLVASCDARMRPLASYHSRADGSAHGTVAACEFGDDLMVASRGAGRILRLAGLANGQ